MEQRLLPTEIMKSEFEDEQRQVHTMKDIQMQEALTEDIPDSGMTAPSFSAPTNGEQFTTPTSRKRIIKSSPIVENTSRFS